MRRVLELAAYRRLLITSTLNEIAWAFGTVALSYLVYRRTGSAIGTTGFFLCAVFVPALTAPVLVARIDRFAARLALPSLYLSEAVAFLLLALVARHFSLPAILALSLIDGILSMTARPLSRTASVAVTSAAGLLREGNALANGFYSIAFMVGPALGGVAVAIGGPSAALVINVCVFAVMALSLATCRALPEAHADTNRHGRLRAAIRYITARPSMRTLLSLQAASFVFFAISVPVEVVFARHSLHTGAGGYGALLSGWGGGAVVGSAVFARFRHASNRVLIAGASALIGLGMAGMAAAPALAAAVAAASVAGIGNGIYVVALRTALQEMTDGSWMALVMSFSDAIAEAMPGLGFLIGGGVTALANPRVALAVGAAGSLMVAVAAWATLDPSRVFIRPAVDPPLS